MRKASFDFVGLRGADGLSKSSVGPTNRRSFKGLDPKSLNLIPSFVLTITAHIKIVEHNSAKVPLYILEKGLTQLKDDTPILEVYPGSPSGTTFEGTPVRTFGDLVKVIERSLEMEKEPLPWGWKPRFVSPFETLYEGKRLIDKKERGVNVWLDGTLDKARIVLHFRITNLSGNGTDRNIELAIPVPGIEIIDAHVADAKGSKLIRG